MTLLSGRRCLGDEISEYAAGRLDPRAARQVDLHLVACQSCRMGVDQERRLQLAFTSGAPAVPADLRSTLLSLAASAAASQEARAGLPQVPRAPMGMPSLPPAALPVVAPGAPALHRSVLRSAVIATAVAGASAAAAFGLTITTTQAVSSGGGRPAAPISSPTPGGQPTGDGIGVQQAGTMTAATYRRTLPEPAMFTIAPPGAQSSP